MTTFGKNKNKNIYYIKSANYLRIIFQNNPRLSIKYIYF